MVSRAETMEKLLGRRAVSCFGFALLLLALLLILALAWPYLFPDNQGAKTTPEKKNGVELPHNK